MNEGHAAFAVLERARDFMQENAQPFEVALAVTRAGNLFTTHTAVAAGFDRFAPALIEQYLGGYAEQKLDLSLRDLLALGRSNPSDSSELFNMAYLAMRGSGAVNGVSRLHGQVSRHIFRASVPALAGARSAGRTRDQWRPRADLGLGRCRRSMDASLRQRPLARERRIPWRRTYAASPTPVSGNSAPPPASPWSNTLASDWRANWPLRAPRPRRSKRRSTCSIPIRLTLGFARRFATYKRPNLLLHDPDRLLRLLSDPQRPVQLIIAGKAHPADQAGQALIREWTQFIRRPEVRPHAIFLGDYDMLLTEHLVQGVDVWLNTPRRPWEACGTSGMKVLVNGGINLSELDGWWAEAYTPEVGWALGDGREHGDDPAWDAVEAEALYDLLEREVIPEFYTRDDQGIPGAWVARMRESMARLTPRFSTNRAVREYTEQHYLPAAAAYLARAVDKGASGVRLVAWRHALNEKWTALRFGDVKLETDGEQHVFEVQAYLDDLDPEAVRVELYADGVDGGAPERVEMKRVRQLVGALNGYAYRAGVSAARPAADYTARAIPQRDGVEVPLEDARILWQR